MVLNWRELAVLINTIGPHLEGLFVDRVIVPERSRFISAFIKGEWFVRMSGRRADGGILFSVRPRHPYVAWINGKGPRAATSGTRSGFDLSLSKHLKGLKFSEIQVFDRERVCAFWFGEQGRRLGLLLSLIPAVPEAFLVADEGEKGRFRILSRSREKGDIADGWYVVPDGARAPENPPLRTDEISHAGMWAAHLEAELLAEAFDERLKQLRKRFKGLLDEVQERIEQAERAIAQADGELDWQYFGDLLKAAIGENPPLDSEKFREVRDYSSGLKVRVPCDPKLSLKEQVSKFYQNAKRKVRRESEARNRIERFRELEARASQGLTALLDKGDWSALERLERSLPTQIGGPGPAKEKKSGAWLGKSFVSKDGLAILVGRSRDENLELTFKLARGNDIWMHVRGRPGAHVLIPLQPGKSAPLETLLDAATLAIWYSGGEAWGKTEVDYTFKKYVKRIRDSTEASYTNNKTLIVEPTSARIKRLTEGSG